MRISRCNGEGYHDPTSHAALSKIVKKKKPMKRGYRPLVYICSYLAGDIENNTQKARCYCRFAVRNGSIPLAPHLFFPQFMDDTVPAERSFEMFMNMVLLGKCDQMWVFGSRISTEMAAEIEKVEKRNMQIRYFKEKMEERL